MPVAFNPKSNSFELSETKYVRSTDISGIIIYFSNAKSELPICFERVIGLDIDILLDWTLFNNSVPAYTLDVGGDIYASGNVIAYSDQSQNDTEVQSWDVKT